MKTLRKGNKGEEVKTLQNALVKAGYKITPDGDFGPKTEAAVKDFQKTHKDSDGKPLSVDGVVGPKTWDALGVGTSKPSSNSKCVDPSVVYLPLSVHVSHSPGRPIKYLAIHYTAGGSSVKGSARAIKKVFEDRKASADFAVDDAEMVQFNPDLHNYYCWAVGDKKAPGVKCEDGHNKNTISIEICSKLKKGTSGAVPNHDGWSYSEAALANGARLAKILMKKFNIPLTRVVRHYDITGKLCPGIVGWNDGPLYTTEGKLTKNKNNSTKWNAFKKRLE